jgi:hypothetical protein
MVKWEDLIQLKLQDWEGRKGSTSVVLQVVLHPTPEVNFGAQFLGPSLDLVIKIGNKLCHTVLVCDAFGVWVLGGRKHAREGVPQFPLLFGLETL